MKSKIKTTLHAQIATIEISEKTAVLNFLNANEEPFISFNFDKDEKGITLDCVKCGEIDITLITCGEVIELVAQKIIERQKGSSLEDDLKELMKLGLLGQVINELKKQKFGENNV